MAAVHDQTTQGGKRGKSVGAQIRSQVLKESKGIPNLIFRIEAFENEALRLGTICKMDLLEKTKVRRLVFSVSFQKF